jgi:CubicO group peptidase (beta-lactamase class C family)
MSKFSLAAVGVLLLIVAGKTVYAQGQTETGVEWKDANEELNRRVERTFSQDGPGASILILKDGAPIYRRFIGLADLETGRPIDADTVFYIASVSKLITATAVLQLVEQSKLRLDDTLGALLPSSPSCAAQVTVEQLLSHTSGVPDFFDFYEAHKRSTAGMTNGDVLAFLQESKLDFPPGTKWGYSNSAYVLLALAVEAKTAKPLRVVLAEGIFQPLRMSHAVLYDETRPAIQNCAVGYSKRDASFVKDDIDSFTVGPGGVFATLDDLVAFDEGLRAGKILRRETLARATQSVKTANGRPTPFGLGWQSESWDRGPLAGQEYFGAFGQLHGFRALYMRVEKSGLTFIAMTNCGVDPLSLEMPELFLVAHDYQRQPKGKH